MQPWVFASQSTGNEHEKKDTSTQMSGSRYLDQYLRNAGDKRRTAVPRRKVGEKSLD